MAWALALLAALLLWFGGVAPIWSLYDARAVTLDQKQALAGRMAALAQSLPVLRKSAASGPSGDAQSLLEGATDAIASAGLLGRVQAMAAQAGVTLASIEALPTETPGGPTSYRRISLRVSVSGPWGQMIALLRAFDQATPRMLVDDLQLRVLQGHADHDAAPLDGSLTVTALRAGSAP